MADIGLQVRLKETKRLLEESRKELANLRHSITDLHAMAGENSASGITSGYCCECDTVWPCLTWHVASGYGATGYRKCRREKWCEHEGVKW